MLQVYYISKATLKTANKQYTSVKNDYEMTFNSDTIIEPCDEQTDLPSISFDFVKIDTLESKQPQAVIGKWAGEMSCVWDKMSVKPE